LRLLLMVWLNSARALGKCEHWKTPRSKSEIIN
jgi:hypothetical protein